jgi:hypothetical protein
MMCEIKKNQFIDNILGTCTYEAFFITPSVAGGGYNFTCKKGFGSVDFMKPEDVIKMAEDVGMMVNLAGWDWELIAHKGLGEKVSTIEAKKFLIQARHAIEKKYAAKYK